MASTDAIAPKGARTPDRATPEPKGPSWTDLPARFTATVPDDALAPRVVRGYGIIFDSTKTPRDGHGVCVVTGNDEAYVRIYRDTRDGFYEAVPLNSRLSRSSPSTTRTSNRFASTSASSAHCAGSRPYADRPSKALPNGRSTSTAGAWGPGEVAG
jgi:hypothetical protein